MARPAYVLQVGFGSSPDEPIASTTWTDISGFLDVKAGVKISRGRSDEQAEVQPSKMSLTLKNSDGRFTKGNPASPYWPNVRTGKRIRLGLTWLGVTYWRFTGDVAEWPTEWGGGPATYAQTRLAAVDRFKQLGELGEYRSTLEEDVLDDGPLGYWPLTEPAGSVAAADISGRSQPPLTVAQIGGGGTIAFGYDGPADSPTNDRAVPDFYVGKQTGVKLIPATNIGFYPQGKYLRAQLRDTTTSTTGATVQAVVWHGSSGLPAFAPVAFLVAANGSYFGIHRSAVDGGMTGIFWNTADGSSAEVAVPAGDPLTDIVSLLTAVLDVPAAGQVRLTFYWNGVPYGTPDVVTSIGVPTWNEVRVGGRDKFVDGVFRGNLSHVAVWDRPVPQNPIVGHFFAAFQGRDAAGNTTVARLNKLCTYSDLGVLNWDSSLTPQPVGGQEIAGDPIAAARLVEATEGGMFYLDGAGRPVLELRSARFNAAPVLTLDAGKLDPDALTFRGDDFGLLNDVTGSAPDGTTVRVVNEASRAEHGRRKASFSAVPANAEQLRALTAWQANTYGTDRNRVTGVRISLLNDPALIPAALALAPGGKVAVTGLPAQAPATSIALYAEGWDEVIGEDDWSLELNTSPGEVGDVWQIGVPGRSEIGTTTRIGY